MLCILGTLFAIFCVSTHAFADYDTVAEIWNHLAGVTNEGE